MTRLALNLAVTALVPLAGISVARGLLWWRDRQMCAWANVTEEEAS